MHHRGFTHTLIAAIPIGLIAAGLGAKLGSLKDRPGLRLYSLGVVSVLLHIAADFLNNYGVHPFSPFMNRWFYGDAIFIIEPLFLFVLLPFAFFSAQAKLAKGLILFLELGLLGLVLGVVVTPWRVSVGICIWAGAWALVQRKFKSSVLALVGIVTTVFVFRGGSEIARRKFNSEVQTIDQHTSQIQLVTSPAPSNPFCWSIQSLYRDKGQNYVVRSAVMSLIPTLFSAENCYSKINIFKSPALQPIQNKNQASLYWIGEFRRPWREFETLKNRDCYFREFLKFARIPIWYQTSDTWVAEDLRYSRSSRGNFTQIVLYSGRDCPNYDVPWEPPTKNGNP